LDIIFKNRQPVSAKAGGSVLNSSVSLGRLGIDVNFISDYGSDEVGELIDGFLNENHVNTDNVIHFEKNNSAIALAFLNENNDASYTFYKDFPEKRLEGLSIDFGEKDYLLFGSFFAITDSIRDSLLQLLDAAKNAGTTIIYDPNFRKAHLHELDMVRPWIIENIYFADIVKGSDEDFELIFGASDANEAYKNIVDSGCNNLIYTRGADDVTVITREVNLQVEVPSINPLSTIGAGDNFNAGIVYTLFMSDLHRKEIGTLSSEGWMHIVKNGISFASEVCMSYDNYISKEFASRIMSRKH